MNVQAAGTLTWITICDTCKREGWAADGGATDGERLAGLIEAQAARQEIGAVRLRRFSCLMGCTHGCNVAVQAAGKLGYTIGRFEPSEETAEAILAWARLHAASETGQVPYRDWPQAIKGHFITRHPPLPAAGLWTEDRPESGSGRPAIPASDPAEPEK